WWLLRAVAEMPRPHQRRSEQLGGRAAHATRRHGPDDGLRASRLLAAHGHAARQESARGALAEWKCALEELAMTSRAYPDPAFWRGRKVVITGHTGFKGAWLTLWLRQLGAQLSGIGLSPATRPSLFDLAGIAELCDSHFCDIRDAAALAALIR